MWLTDERVFGRIEGALGAFFTTIAYNKGGIEYEALMENDEFELMEDLIEYDSE